ncbi:nucleotidyltransferase family protein [Nonlabens dokdonensis DSW-6]|uniref:Nucleotidyltransferase family protein n=1 Tax=Nonlabens dokdonensis (strain DSM 17205 / KCTC 12402 / DSW-6) TaxID=592029 RepID=L7WD37_NONDD|nr:nucleotidyltransferase family protein [Nonlabens dokdonensis DSW-6]
MEYKVSTLAAFGSVLREDFNDTSDIDFAIDFNETDPIKYANLYFELKQKLEELFKRKIDLIELRAVKNKFFKEELDKNKVTIYGL